MAQMTETERFEMFATSAAEMAEKLGMHTMETITHLSDGDTILLATADGIQMGTARCDSGTMRTYQYEHYTLNDTQLFSTSAPITEAGWGQASESIKLDAPYAIFIQH